MAEKSGRLPSEIAGVRCRYCAWCFDETLYLLQAGWERDAAEQARLEAELERERQRMRRG